MGRGIGKDTSVGHEGSGRVAVGSQRAEGREGGRGGRVVGGEGGETGARRLRRPPGPFPRTGEALGPNTHTYIW